MVSPRTCVLLAAVALGPVALAQTSTTNPQTPARTVESVLPQAKVRERAARLDSLLERSLRRLGESALPLVDDATFVRRAHLQIVGRIPTLAETEQFLADPSPNKRADLCDRLLDGPGRTSHFANFWFDLLRVKSRQQALSGEPFAHYLREAVRQDLPYDRMVREMLTAEGAGHKQGNGATGMLLRDTNMPHDAMANALRLFLGTRLECAQCHNHPSDVWTQRQFYQMAAFFGGLRYRDDTLPNLVGLRGELAQAEERTRQQALQLVRRMNQGLDGSGTGVEKLPRDYKYDDGKPGDRIAASTIFGPAAKLKAAPPGKDKDSSRGNRRERGEAAPPAVDSRTSLAQWLTTPKNPRFTAVIANRLWARTFGRGLVEPLDDWRPDTTAVHPELFDALQKLLVELGYDLRQFERVLVHTQLFQRQATGADEAAARAFAFPGPLLRRMTAEQVWDSLLTLVFDDLDERLRETDARARPVYEQYAELAAADAKQLIAMVERGRNPMQRQQQEQAEAARRAAAADQELQARARPLLRQLATARRNGDQALMLEIAAQLQAMGLPLGQRAARGREGEFVRASDLAQPAPAGHLLRQFGQSDRETVDAARAEATVPQVLTLLNGFLDQRVLEGRSALRRDLDLTADGERRVRIAFLTTLNREPSADELRDWRPAIASGGDAAIKDLVWVLCNSNEFRFVP
ncbi:MAG: DUF1549 domain-containing protein [Planctomycetes bacterium]|nr:DUF1549 domain-containing protein [Planctomycetota bacterium]